MFLSNVSTQQIAPRTVLKLEDASEGIGFLSPELGRQIDALSADRTVPSAMDGDRFFLSRFEALEKMKGSIKELLRCSVWVVGFS